MNQFLLHHQQSKELELFPHILELGIRKNTTIQLNSLSSTASDHIRIYYVLEGRFEWVIQDRHSILYPGDLAIILPQQTFRGEKDLIDIGTMFWIHIQVERMENDSRIVLGNWSGLSESESRTIGRVLHLNNTSVLVRMKDAHLILQAIQTELFQQQIGYQTRVNQLVDELLILVARQSTHQYNLQRDFPKVFVKLEQALRQNLSYQWTVEEMAAMVGLGTTAFNERVKSYSGFSPLNYLINIRISEAIKLLRRPESSVTSIALDTGFYSSQHFSTTFKKLTGYTPGEFRKKNTSKN
jgi:AraC-like DNA-binding protein